MVFFYGRLLPFRLADLGAGTPAWFSVGQLGLGSPAKHLFGLNRASVKREPHGAFQRCDPAPQRVPETHGSQPKDYPFERQTADRELRIVVCVVGGGEPPAQAARSLRLPRC